MTLQLVKGGLVPADALNEPTFNTAFGSAAIDASGEEAGFVVRAPLTGTIDEVYVRLSTVTSAQSLDVGLQAVDAATGLPTGVAYGGSAVGTIAVPASNTGYEVALGTSAAATKNDRLAVVVGFTSAIGNLQVSLIAQNAGFPYAVHKTAAWAKVAASMPVVALKYNGVGWVYMPGCLPVDSFSDVAFNSGSTPDEKAVVINEPYPRRLAGVAVLMSSSGDFDLVLDGGAFSSVILSSQDKDYSGSTAACRLHAYFSDTARDLAANTDYYLSVRPTTTTNISVREYNLSSAAMADAFWGGQSIGRADRTDGGAWSAIDASIRPLIFPIYDEFDDGAGGGGGLLTHPGMSGGFNG